MSDLKNEMWIEAYRPNTLDDVIGHDMIIKVLKKFVAQKNSLNYLIMMFLLLLFK